MAVPLRVRTSAAQTRDTQLLEDIMDDAGLSALSPRRPRKRGYDTRHPRPPQGRRHLILPDNYIALQKTERFLAKPSALPTAKAMQFHRGRCRHGTCGITMSDIPEAADRTALSNSPKNLPRAMKPVRPGGGKPKKPLDKIVDLSSAAVSLANCGIGDDVVLSLAQALRANQSVRDMDLSGNEITDVGAVALADMLQRTRVLKYLNLSKNRLTNDGVIAIAVALRTNKTLQVLSLASNQFGDRAVADLASALRVNSTLQELVLLDCNMTYEGCIAITDALVGNSSLQYLSVPYTMGYRMIHEIQDLLRHNARADTGVVDAIDDYQRVTAEQTARDAASRKQWLTPRPPPPPPCETLAYTEKEQWLDPSMSVTMMYMTLLQKKRERRMRRGDDGDDD